MRVQRTDENKMLYDVIFKEKLIFYILFVSTVNVKYLN
jgi:hypothetical protein